MVFEQIRQAKPQQLFIAADGPRANSETDQAQCLETRHVVETVDWPCKINRLYRSVNLGCKTAVTSSIDWFFENVSQGIVLEDDCLPTQSFFRFCEELLEYYKENERIMHITGNNFQFGRKRGKYSYYFSKYSHIWGWASWRRAWKFYDRDMIQYDQFLKSRKIAEITRNQTEVKYWLDNFNLVKGNKINTWDFQWVFSIWMRDALVIVPNMNLVKNMGFSANGTHTTSGNSKLENMPTGEMQELSHPSIVARDISADRFVYSNILRLSLGQRIRSVFSSMHRMKQRIKILLPVNPIGHN
jgi:hypothetical protein